MFEKQPWMQRAGEYPQTDQEYFTLLARAVFSAGLGPKVVESRWKDMGEAFHGFDPVQVKLMGEEDVARLLSDPAVIRNRRKIEAVIKNAGVFLDRVAERKALLTGTDQAEGPAEGTPTGNGVTAGAANGGRKARRVAGATSDGGVAPNGHGFFHEYLLDLGADADVDHAADDLAHSFAHLGRTSAVFFLFSAGWRPREDAGLPGSLPVPANG